MLISICLSQIEINIIAKKRSNNFVSVIPSVARNQVTDGVCLVWVICINSPTLQAYHSLWNWFNLCFLIHYIAFHEIWSKLGIAAGLSINDTPGRPSTIDHRRVPGRNNGGDKECRPQIVELSPHFFWIEFKYSACLMIYLWFLQKFLHDWIHLPADRWW